MIIKNSLLALAVLSTVVACGTEKKSHRGERVAPETTVAPVQDNQDGKATEEKKEEAKPEVTPEVKPEVPEVKPEEPKPAEPAPEVKPALPIVGQWSGCESLEGVSLKHQYAFTAENSVEISKKLYKGDDCQNAFTAEEIEAQVQIILSEGQVQGKAKGKVSEPSAEAKQEAEDFKQAANGVTYKGSFQTGADNTIEFTVGSEKSTSTYTIENNTLTLSRVDEGETIVTTLTRN